MASSEWLREHRHLQYLRAAAREARSEARDRTSRRRYADRRWLKLQDVPPERRGPVRRASRF